jgi:putative N6-adenine-specific DNA methylase
VARELDALGLAPAPEPGGVSFSGDLDAIYPANLWLRAATRVLVRVGDVEARDFARLRRRAARLPWDAFPRAPRVEVTVTARRSRLYHTSAVAERIAGAVADSLGPPGPESPELHLVVRGQDDVFTISADSSGELLHRRGYRTEDAGAPLRETLAAGLLSLCGWDGTRPVHDPTCGSGTIPIEAALLAAGRAPGLGRRFACEGWPGARPALFAALRVDAAGIAPGVTIGGSDLEPAAIAAAGRNAARAGVSDWLSLAAGEAAAVRLPPGPGLVLANPPYGRRLRAAGAVYRALGRLARAAGWELAVLTAEESLARLAGRPAERIALVNGGVRVGLYRY